MRDIEIIRNYFFSQNCVLLETEYVNGKTPMRYICACGNESKIRYDNFVNRQRCQKCKAKKSSIRNTKYTYNDAYRIFKENDCLLIETADTYVNSQNYVQFICKCGNQSKTTLSLFLGGRRCSNCKIKRMASTRRASISDVRNFFESEKYTLLSEEYINTSIPLRYRCPKGHEGKISLDNWKRGKQRCRKCYEENNTGENHPNWCVDRKAKALRDSIRRRCFGLLHNTLTLTNQTKRGRSFEILGYTCKELQDHLSSFDCWDSLKKRHWHIDHIYPIDAFVKNNITDLKIINALENLQPMLGRENIIKGNRYNKRNFKHYLKKKHNIIIQ